MNTGNGIKYRADNGLCSSRPPCCDKLSYVILAFLADKMRSVTFPPTMEAISTEINTRDMVFG